ncbi:MAG TPA: hypothetical protein VFE30_07760 [Anaeromyxobacteraceae bacterium]|nr:hypothetical protein [Anaeromyxobacteraceae bacterium]
MTKTRWMTGAAMAGAMTLLTAQAQAQSSSGYGTGSSGSDTNKSSTSSTTGSSTSDTATPGTASDASQLQGKVQNFDRTNNTLTLSGSDKALKIDSSTQVMKNGSRASLNDIKEGDQVRASFSGSGDMLHVQRLDVMSSGSTGTGTGTMGGATGTESSGSGATSGTGSTGSKDDMSGSSSTGSSTTDQSTTKEKSHTEKKGSY